MATTTMQIRDAIDWNGSHCTATLSEGSGFSFSGIAILVNGTKLIIHSTSTPSWAGTLGAAFVVHEIEGDANPDF